MSARSNVHDENVVVSRGGLLDLTEARAFLGGVSRAFLYAEFESGRLQSVKIGRRRMVPRNALIDYVASRLRGCEETQ